MPKKNEPTYREYKAQLDQQIRTGSYTHATLICGDEDYLRTQNRDVLRDAILGDGDRMNCTSYQGTDFSMNEVIDLANTLPFFAEHRVIVMENTGLFWQGAGADADRLAEYLLHVPETTYFIFVEAQTNGTMKLFRTVKKIGFVMKCDTPDDGELRAFIREELRANGLNISGPAAALLLAYAGDDMLNIHNECQKLSDYCYGRSEATQEDIRTICSPRTKDRIFDMINAIVRGSRTEAMQIYMDLCKLQTPPQVILSLMMRQYNQLLQVGELNAEGKTPQEIASMLHLNPWALQNRILPLARTQSAMGLQRALQDCVQANMDYRSGKIDAQVAAEELIIRFSSAEENGSMHIRRPDTGGVIQK